MWKVCAVAALAIALTPAEGLLQGNQNRQQQRRQEWSTAVAAAPPSPPSPAKNAKISAHLLGGEPLPLQPKAPTPSSCPGGCAANGECDTSTPTATCLCHAGFERSGGVCVQCVGYQCLRASPNVLDRSTDDLNPRSFSSLAREKNQYSKYWINDLNPRSFSSLARDTLSEISTANAG